MTESTVSEHLSDHYLLALEQQNEEQKFLQWQRLAEVCTLTADPSSTSNCTSVCVAEMVDPSIYLQEMGVWHEDRWAHTLPEMQQFQEIKQSWMVKIFSEITTNSFISWRSARISNLWKMFHQAVYFLTNEPFTVKKYTGLKESLKIQQ